MREKAEVASRQGAGNHRFTRLPCHHTAPLLLCRELLYFTSNKHLSIASHWLHLIPPLYPAASSLHSGSAFESGLHGV